ncbi:hypothetical protein JOM56_012823 [Amanita muscaria]
MTRWPTGFFGYFVLCLGFCPIQSVIPTFSLQNRSHTLENRGSPYHAGDYASPFVPQSSSTSPSTRDHHGWRLPRMI